MAVTFTPSGTASAGGVQQSYALVHAALLEGQLSDIRNNTIGTYINETAVRAALLVMLQVYNSAGTVANSAKTHCLPLAILSLASTSSPMWTKLL
jgi:hypothetical protein